MINPFEKLDERLDRIERQIVNLNNSKNNQENQDELLLIGQAAEFLRLTKATIYLKVSQGDLPHMKRGKRLYFSKLDLIKYIKQGRVKTRAEVVNEASDHLVKKRS